MAQRAVVIVMLTFLEVNGIGIGIDIDAPDPELADWISLSAGATPEDLALRVCEAFRPPLAVSRSDLDPTEV